MTAAHLPPEVGFPPRFCGVLPLGIELGERGGHHVVLLGLELWDGWADLRFARIDIGARRPLPRRVPPSDAWRVTIDGEPSEVMDAVGRGDRGFSNGEVRLRPPPHPGARLEIMVEVMPGEEPLGASFRLPDIGTGPS